VGQVLGAAMSINQVSIALAPLIFGFLLDLARYPASAWLSMAALLIVAAAEAMRGIADDPTELAQDMSIHLAGGVPDKD
jgi:hypothetical protein